MNDNNGKQGDPVARLEALQYLLDRCVASTLLRVAPFGVEGAVIITFGGGDTPGKLMVNVSFEGHGPSNDPLECVAIALGGLMSHREATAEQETADRLNIVDPARGKPN
jgi:hypothetical protein